MTLQILGGTLTPRPHDGSVQDLVYGVDGAGLYIGLVPAAGAAQAASCAPPKMGVWKWVGNAWVPFKTKEELGSIIDQLRDEKLAAGMTFNGRVWYTDPGFTTHVQAFLQAYTDGILAPTATVGIRGMDKIVYQLNRLELRALAGALMAYVQGVYQWSWDEKAKVSD